LAEEGKWQKGEKGKRKWLRCDGPTKFGRDRGESRKKGERRSGKLRGNTLEYTKKKKTQVLLRKKTGVSGEIMEGKKSLKEPHRVRDQASSPDINTEAAPLLTLIRKIQEGGVHRRRRIVDGGHTKIETYLKG